MLQAEVRKEIDSIRRELLQARVQIGGDLTTANIDTTNDVTKSTYDVTNGDTKPHYDVTSGVTKSHCDVTIKQDMWQSALTRLDERLHVLNTNVNKLNMIVPALHMQMIPFSAKRELARSLREYSERRENGTLPVIDDSSNPSKNQSLYSPYSGQYGFEPVTFRTILKNITELFSLYNTEKKKS